MTNKHTPGTWYFDKDLSAIVVVTGHQVKAVADFGKVDNEEANALRIVACVNACEGFSTESLESSFSVVRRAQIIADQRDALLECAILAKEFEQHAGGAHLPASKWFELHQKLDAAIAKAKGEL